MKFINISDTKLKVILTPTDLCEYGIDASDGDYTTPRVRAAVREILTRAERECGFSADGERILVQIYPLPSGECELLVTRLTALSRRNRDVLAASDGISLLESSRAVYRFDTLPDMRSALRITSRPDARADLYRDDLGRYYLCRDETLTDGISEFEIFIEYGDRLSALPLAVLSEYGERLATDTPLSTILSEYTL